MSATDSRVSVAGAGFIILGATSIQWSAALVQPAFSRLGPVATSGWRFLLGFVTVSEGDVEITDAGRVFVNGRASSGVPRSSWV